MGATKIMVIRHAEKPEPYDGTKYSGVDAVGTTCGADGAESLVTIGWERAGALVTLFAPPWGPKTPILAQPQHIYASDPTAKDNGRLPSQRPYETVTAIATKLGLPVNTKHKRSDYPRMVQDALGEDGAVLICWQHQDIPLEADGNVPGISQCILADTGTQVKLGVPKSWPKGLNGVARYDLVWVFDRPSGTGPISGFKLFAQMLLPGDTAAPT